MQVRAKKEAERTFNLRKMPKTYAVLSNYNTLRWIDDSLGSLRASATPLHTVVVDDASPDGSSEKIERDFPEVTLIRLPENVGFSAANNRGILYALQQGADYLFLLNMDAWIEPDTVETLVRIAEMNPEYGIISPMHLNGAGTGFDRRFARYVNSDLSPQLFSDIYLGTTADLYETDRVNAAAWLVRRELFLTIGLFDPLLRQHGQDDNFIDRMRWKGYKIGVTPHARIRHDRDHRAGVNPSLHHLPERQKKRAMVIALDPNRSPFAAFLLILRKQTGDLFTTLQTLDPVHFFTSLRVLITGALYPFRYRNRHLKLQQMIQIEPGLEADE